MRWLALVLTVAVLAGCKEDTSGEESAGPAPQSTKVEPPADFDGFTIPTSDGHWVAARSTANNNSALGMVVMFHQAGSNMHEYDPIVPRVAKLGYDCLVVDQRAGGDMWEEKNVTQIQYEGEQSYMDAYKDMEAALAWAKEQGYKRIIVWGSSYSASLVLKLAAEHADDVFAVLSFSPGEYFDEPGLVASWNAKVKVPRFFAATSDELAKDGMAIYMASPGDGNKMLGFKDGVHGSSTLREDKCPQRAEDYWKGVEEFFKSLDKKKA